jgi:RNA polymerase sigma-70 factor (ECF subfamily)
MAQPVERGESLGDIDQRRASRSARPMGSNLGGEGFPDMKYSRPVSHLAVVSSPEATRDAFEEAYRQHVGFVWRSLRSLGVAEAGLEDACHEVFIVLLRRWDDWDPRTRMTTWLYGIAYGVVLNHRRSVRRRERKLVALRAHALESRAVDLPVRALECREAIEIVESFLDRLDDKKRRVFELAEIEGIPAVEIARCLGLNVNTVGSRLRRARRQFDRFLLERGFIGDDASQSDPY